MSLLSQSDRLRVIRALKTDLNYSELSESEKNQTQTLLNWIQLEFSKNNTK